MKHMNRRKKMKRRYKRLVAAVAGAAVLSSAILPGLPVSRVFAAENPSAANTAATAPAGQTGNSAEDKLSTPSSFSAMTRSQVKIKPKGHTENQIFKAALGQEEATVLSDPEKTSDSPTPYPLAGVMPRSITATAGIIAADQQVLYQTSGYNDWTWTQSGFPQDMVLGFLLQDPRQYQSPRSIPDYVTNQLNEVDFSRQFVLYAHLGTVAPQGYGIAITKVSQTGNDLTVNIRMKSPGTNGNTELSKADDFLPLNRLALDFGSPIHITFVDEANGTILMRYSIG